MCLHQFPAWASTSRESCPKWIYLELGKPKSAATPEREPTSYRLKSLAVITSVVWSIFFPSLNAPATFSKDEV